MLRKLMKYEFKATKRIMLPAIIVLFLISIFNGVFFGVIEPHISKNNIFVNLFGYYRYIYNIGVTCTL